MALFEERVQVSYFIKFWESTIENEIWQNDPVAWRIFEYLLVMAYRGKPQGTMRTTRYKIENIVNVNNSTAYRALARLEKAKMVTTSRTSKFTTVRICNWHKYQGSGELDGEHQMNIKRTSNEHSYKISKNKEILTNVSMAKPVYGNSEINEMVALFEADGVKLKSQTKQRQAAQRIIKRVEKGRAIGVVRAAIACQTDQFAPTIGDLVALDKRLSDLVAYYKKNSQGKVLRV